MKQARSSTPQRTSPKLAEHVAELIEDDIINSGWEVGFFLGSEADLAEKYGVGRWVMREALGIVERDGLIEIRRGRHGGIRVSGLALDAVGSLLRGYLGVCHITEQDTFEARLVLERLASRLLSQQLFPEKLRMLRELVEKTADITKKDALPVAYQFLEEIMRATDNIALEVFSYTTAKITTDLFVRRGMSEAALQSGALTLLKKRREQISAIITGDTVLAEKLTGEYLATQGKIGTKSSRGNTIYAELLDMPRKSLLDNNGGRPNSSRPKLTHQLTQLIEAEIVANNWPVGRRLGTEAELMDRYQVSRAVLREAIRPLERLGVVEMCRGRDSGLKVTQPDPASVIRSAVRYLAYCKMDARTAQPVREAIELALIQLKARNSAEHRAALANRLREVADSPPAKGKLANELSQIVAETADNQILGLYCRILAAFSPPVDEATDSDIKSGGTRDAMRALASALEDGDEALARSIVLNIRHTGETH